MIDFYDFGCSDGKSIELARAWFSGKRGIGLDLSAKKVEAARAAGFEVMQADISQLTGYEKSSRFVMASHFLEHLPDVQLAAKCLRAACETAREFVFVRQPWFDSDGYLVGKGLKLYWSDWQDHHCHMTSLDFVRILSRTPGVRRFAVYGAQPIVHSADSAVHSIHSPHDQHDWSESRHPARPFVQFNSPVYREIRVLITLSGAAQSFEELEAKFDWHARIYDSIEAERHTEALPSLPYTWTTGSPLAVGGTVNTQETGTTALHILANGPDPQIELPQMNFGDDTLVEVMFEAPGATQADLYVIRKGNVGWGDSRPISVPVVPGLNNVRLTTGPGERIERLRFDPGRLPGRYSIHRIGVARPT